MKQSKTLALTLIALLSTAPIVCGPTSRYLELLEAQKTRELTSDEKATLQLLEQFKGWGTKHWQLRDKEYVSGIQLTPFGGVSHREREEILPSFDESFEFGSVVLSGLIKKQDASTEKIMPLEKDLFAPIISAHGPIWECNGRRYSRIQHVSTDDWKVIVKGPLEPLDACNQESNNNNNADKNITLTASLIAAHAQTDGVNYERLAESLEQLHTFNTLQAQINKLSHLDEID